MRRTSAPWSSAGRCLCTVRARSRISHNEGRLFVFPLGGHDSTLKKRIILDFGVAPGVTDIDSHIQAI
jgi:hypothetical protein